MSARGLARRVAAAERARGGARSVRVFVAPRGLDDAAFGAWAARCEGEAAPGDLVVLVGISDAGDDAAGLGP